jgi:hypothetical protein
LGNFVDGREELLELERGDPVWDGLEDGESVREELRFRVRDEGEEARTLGWSGEKESELSDGGREEGLEVEGEGGRRGKCRRRWPSRMGG